MSNTRTAQQPAATGTPLAAENGAPAGRGIDQPAPADRVITGETVVAAPVNGPAALPQQETGAADENAMLRSTGTTRVTSTAETGNPRNVLLTRSAQRAEPESGYDTLPLIAAADEIGHDLVDGRRNRSMFEPEVELVREWSARSPAASRSNGARTEAGDSAVAIPEAPAREEHPGAGQQAPAAVIPEAEVTNGQVAQTHDPEFEVPASQSAALQPGQPAGAADSAEGAATVAAAESDVAEDVDSAGDMPGDPTGPGNDQDAPVSDADVAPTSGDVGAQETGSQASEPDVAPVFNSEPVVAALEGDTIEGLLAASDGDNGDALTFSVAGATADDSLAGFDQSVTSPFGTLHIDSTTGAYRFVADADAVATLGAGETASAAFDVTVTDATGASASQPLAFTITGSNEAPIFNNDPVRAMLEGSVLEGTLAAADSDMNDTLTFGIHGADADDSIAGFDLSIASVFGNLYLDSTSGAYRFIADAETQTAMGAGETGSLNFTAQVNDLAGASSTQPLNITVIGSNDAPNYSNDPISQTIFGTAAVSDVNGILTATDSDVGDILNFRIAGADVDSSLAGFDQSMASQFGVLYVDSATGAYRFVADSDAIAAMPEGSTASTIFSITVSDLAGEQVSQPLTITVKGGNDAPVFTHDPLLMRVEGGTLEGTLTASDADSTDVLTYQFDGSTPDDSLAGFDQSLTTSYGTLYLNSVSGAYRFVADADTMTSMAEGETASVDLTVQVTDLAGAGASQPLTLTVHGSNDAPIFSSEPVNAMIDPTVTLAAEGMLTANDSDVGDVLRFAAPGATADDSLAGFDQSVTTALGALHIDSITGAYRFVADADAVATLGAGETASLAFDVTVTDATGASASQPLTITVSGSNDAPVTISGLEHSATDIMVDEGDLAAGSHDTKSGADRASGFFTVEAPDGVATLEITSLSSDQAVALTMEDIAALSAGQTVEVVTMVGTLILNGFTGTAEGGVISYEYLLGGALLHEAGAGENDIAAIGADRFLVSVVDSDGSQVMTHLDVQIIDDTPALGLAADTAGPGATVGTLQGMLDIAWGADGPGNLLATLASVQDLDGNPLAVQWESTQTATGIQLLGYWSGISGDAAPELLCRFEVDHDGMFRFEQVASLGPEPLTLSFEGVRPSTYKSVDFALGPYSLVFTTTEIATGDRGSEIISVSQQGLGAASGNLVTERSGFALTTEFTQAVPEGSYTVSGNSRNGLPDFEQVSIEGTILLGIQKLSPGETVEWTVFDALGNTSSGVFAAGAGENSVTPMQIELAAVRAENPDFGGFTRLDLFSTTAGTDFRVNFIGIQEDAADFDISYELGMSLEDADGDASQHVSLHIDTFQGEPELTGAQYADGSRLVIHSDPTGEPLTLGEVLPASGSTDGSAGSGSTGEPLTALDLSSGSELAILTEEPVF